MGYELLGQMFPISFGLVSCSRGRHRDPDSWAWPGQQCISVYLYVHEETPCLALALGCERRCTGGLRPGWFESNRAEAPRFNPARATEEMRGGATATAWPEKGAQDSRVASREDFSHVASVYHFGRERGGE